MSPSLCPIDGCCVYFASPIQFAPCLHLLAGMRVALVLAALTGLVASQSVPTVNCTQPLPKTLADFSGTLLNGTSISLSQFVGNVTLVRPTAQ